MKPYQIMLLGISMLFILVAMECMFLKSCDNADQADCLLSVREQNLTTKYCHNGEMRDRK